jgi:hypothetical protein
MPTRSKAWSACSKSSIVLCIATALWLAWYCIASAASGSPGSRTGVRQPPAVEERTGMEGNTALGRTIDPLRARLEQLSERDMKLFYSRCSREGLVRRLEGGEAMACSIGYDVLLKKHFAGDFERLLSWSRSWRASDLP